MYVTHPLDSCIHPRIDASRDNFNWGSSPPLQRRWRTISRNHDPCFNAPLGGAGRVVSRLWRSNCEPHCFSVVCNSGGRGGSRGTINKARKQWASGKTMPPQWHGSFAAVPPPLIIPLRAKPPAFSRYPAKNRVEKNRLQEETTR